MAKPLYVYDVSTGEDIKLPTNRPVVCKVVVDTLGGGAIPDDKGLLVQDSVVLQPGLKYTFKRQYPTGTNRGLAEALQAICDRLDRLISRADTLEQSQLRRLSNLNSLSNHNSSYPYSRRRQAAYRAALIKRYQHSDQTDHPVCMVTGLALPPAGIRAAHLVHLSKFALAQADIPLTDPWDVRNGMLWLDAVHKAYNDSRLMVMWDKEIHNFRVWVLDTSLLDKPLSTGWPLCGSRCVRISHSTHYPDMTWRSLHGRPMHYQFVQHVHPSRRVLQWHASLAYELAKERSHVPADVPDPDAMQEC